MVLLYGLRKILFKKIKNFKNLFFMIDTYWLKSSFEIAIINNFKNIAKILDLWLKMLYYTFTLKITKGGITDKIRGYSSKLVAVW